MGRCSLPAPPPTPPQRLAAHGDASAPHHTSSPQAPSGCGALLILQHPPTYTLGSGATLDHLRFDVHAPPAPLFRSGRGGEVTYHGPGQLVLYPILDLAADHRPDLHWYMRALEEVVIRALASPALGVSAGRVPGLTGVWSAAGRKVAAVGVRARRWITFHGVALNVTTDLEAFAHIVPCGIGDRPVGSLHLALRAVAAGEAPVPPPDLDLGGATPPAAPSPESMAAAAAHLAREAAVPGSLVSLAASSLLSAFEEVFEVTLTPAKWVDARQS